MDYLEAENHFLDVNMSDTDELQYKLFDEYVSRIKQDDTGISLVNPTGDVLVSSDSTITKYNIVVEFRKEKGFTNV